MTDAIPPRCVAVVNSPNKPRPDDRLVLAVADSLRRIEYNYAREGSGPGSRFEGQLLEDVQAQFAVRAVRVAEREATVRLAAEHKATYLVPCDEDDHERGLHTHHRRPFADLLQDQEVSP